MSVTLEREFANKLKQIPVLLRILSRNIAKPLDEINKFQLIRRSTTVLSRNHLVNHNGAAFTPEIAVLCRPRWGTVGASLNAVTSKLPTSRNFSSDAKGPSDPLKNDKRDDEEKKPLKLMDFNELIWPNPFKTLKNYFFAWLIRGYFDNHFSRENFMNGAEQAIRQVSGLISEGNFEALEGLVTKEAIKEIRSSCENLSLKQRKFIAINPKDLFFRFIYEIGLIFDDETNKRYVEITAVLQGFHGLDDAKEKNPEGYVEEISKAQDQIYICNYRFIREYTKGKADEWTVNKLNHFSPKELVRNKGIFTR